ncbi:MAG: hypothetical protein KDA41_13700 [Planctomycetales bacterium]|nr:hypothetical protein [Planctomycetales bacterium]
MLRLLLAVAAVYGLWFVTDIVIHCLILGSVYETQTAVFYPAAEMKMGLVQLVVLANAAVFTKIYSWFISPKNLKTGVVYGALYGFAHGFGMGFGTYATMRITLATAWTWTLGAIVQAILAGVVVSLIIHQRDDKPL